MQPFAALVKVTIPNYLSNLPVPDTFGGWFRLGVKDWVSLIPPTVTLAGFTYVTYRAFCPHGRPSPSDKVNLSILKSNPKVVDTIDVKNITDQAAFCRCWRSKNWPYCDGSHVTHNKETRDNIGPIVVKK